MHIIYHKVKEVEYARLAKSYRKDGKVKKSSTNLGRVIDKEKGIYKNRTRGIFRFDLSSMQYSELKDNPYNEQGENDSLNCNSKDNQIDKERLILDFGDTYFIDKFMEKSGIKKVINSLKYKNSDTFYSMLCYYILNDKSNIHAASWYEGNYAKIIYPNAKISSQRISEFLSEIGDENFYRDFFRSYFKYFMEHSADGTNILIDSTGLPNSIHFPLTAISNHNGEISNEVRLIYVVQKETSLPIFFRYCPGNVLDVNTLVRTIKELKENGINTKFTILDAGYYDDENIIELYKNNVSFITRLKQNRKIYKELIKENIGDIESSENLVRYNNRFVYMKCVECELITGYKSYAYIGVDILRKNSETKKLFESSKNQKLSNSEIFEKMKSQGVFILVSSEKIEKEKILPSYYTRQQIEQIFDIGKNYADMLPLRVENENTFRGHLILTFMATVLIKLIQDKLKESVYNPMSLFLNLRNHKCKVYDNRIITQEVFKKANDCYKIFQIIPPIEIELK